MASRGPRAKVTPSVQGQPAGEEPVSNGRMPPRGPLIQLGVAILGVMEGLVVRGLLADVRHIAKRLTAEVQRIVDIVEALPPCRYGSHAGMNTTSPRSRQSQMRRPKLQGWRLAPRQDSSWSIWIQRGRPSICQPATSAATTSQACWLGIAARATAVR